LVVDCPYLAADGTCLLPESELKEKCLAIERVEHEEKDEWILKDYIKERLKSQSVLE
jgi:hypothetical protein